MTYRDRFVLVLKLMLTASAVALILLVVVALAMVRAVRGLPLMARRTINLSRDFAYEVLP